MWFFCLNGIHFSKWLKYTIWKCNLISCTLNQGWKHQNHVSICHRSDIMKENYSWHHKNGYIHWLQVLNYFCCTVMDQMLVICLSSALVHNYSSICDFCVSWSIIFNAFRWFTMMKGTKCYSDHFNWLT